MSFRLVSEVFSFHALCINILILWFAFGHFGINRFNFFTLMIWDRDKPGSQTAPEVQFKMCKCSRSESMSIWELGHLVFIVVCYLLKQCHVGKYNLYYFSPNPNCHVWSRSYLGKTS